MKNGVLLFAFNSANVDYLRMAEFTASRVNHFLNLPVTLITDIDIKNSIFDNVIVTENNSMNYRKKDVVWKNKGRFNAYKYTPYDTTIVLDVDYLINSTTLSNLLYIDQEFMCHYDIRYLFENKSQELISNYSYPTYWATVMKFKKNNFNSHLFNMMEMIETNYEHYAKIHKFMPYVYRNDYALTIALRTLNGQLSNINHNIPWKLIHVESYLKVERISMTEYVIRNTKTDKNKFIKIKDYDFHMLNKSNFNELIQ